MKKTRQLSDRIEEFDDIIEGSCKCGNPINKVIGSNQTNNADKTRYFYPSEPDSMWCIFRCRVCSLVVMDNFIEGRK